MKPSENIAKQLKFMALLSVVLTAGCGGGSSSGGGGVSATHPTVISGVAQLGLTPVPVNTKTIAVGFSTAMAPSTLTPTSITLACPVGTPIPVTITSPSSNLAAIILPAGSNLPANTICTVTVTTAATDAAGNPISSNSAWIFTTGASTDITAPTITGLVHANGATGVPINTHPGVTFSELMDPATINGTNYYYTQGVTPVAGTVSYAGVNAVFTPSANLAISTVYTGHATTGVKDLAGNAMTTNATWSWTTGASTDTTKPQVIGTINANLAVNVATNTQIGATFSEPMLPSSINAATFTVMQGATVVPGARNYSGVHAVFTPTANLAANTMYTATITSAATDLAGNALAGNPGAPLTANAYTWAFTTGAAPNAALPTVLSNNPVNLAATTCINKSISAQFSQAMDPFTLNNVNITLAPSATPLALVTGLVSYDPLTHIASFKPGANLTANTAYTTTITGGVGGVLDITGNALAATQVTTFTTSASSCASAPALGAAATFGAFGGIATLVNDGPTTVINGNAGVNGVATATVGLTDAGGNGYPAAVVGNGGLVNGLIYSLSSPPGSVAGAAVTAVSADALAAFNSISPATLPGGIDMSNLALCPTCGGLATGAADDLGGRTLPPGVYLSLTGNYFLGSVTRTVANLTLDAAGDPDAVWIFQTQAGTGALVMGLTGPATPTTPIHVLLINGAQAKNVFWHLPAGATIGTGSTMVGTMLSNASITFSTTTPVTPRNAVITTLNGRAIALVAAITMTNTVINVPAP